MAKFLDNPFFTFTKINVGVRNQHTFLAFINTPAGFSPLKANIDLLKHIKGDVVASPCTLWRAPRPIAVSIRPLFTSSSEVCSKCRLTALSWLPSFKCFACRQGPFCFLCALPSCHSCSPRLPVPIKRFLARNAYERVRVGVLTRRLWVVPRASAYALALYIERPCAGQLGFPVRAGRLLTRARPTLLSLLLKVLAQYSL
jgi:hypothetical protein